MTPMTSRNVGYRRWATRTSGGKHAFCDSPGRCETDTLWRWRDSLCDV